MFLFYWQQSGSECVGLGFEVGRHGNAIQFSIFSQGAFKYAYQLFVM